MSSSGHNGSKAIFLFGTQGKINEDADGFALDMASHPEGKSRVCVWCRCVQNTGKEALRRVLITNTVRLKKLLISLNLKVKGLILQLPLHRARALQQ